MDTHTAKLSVLAVCLIDGQKGGQVYAVQSYCKHWSGFCAAGATVEATDLTGSALFFGIQSFQYERRAHG